MPKLAIVGGGFMGSAIAEGLIASGWQPHDLVVSEVREARRRVLVDDLQLSVADSAADAVSRAATVLLAVKPQDAEQALNECAPSFPADALLVSICAGISTATIEATLGEVAVIRCMPNTPAAIGHGATAIARGAHASDEHLATALNMLGTVGKVVVVGEDQMDAVTAVSGSGPAYVFYLAEAMIRAAEAEGLSAEHAHVLVYQTISGAARLLRRDPAGPAELRRRVTSPNGTTHAAISHLEAEGWADAFVEAVRRARVRSEELGSS